jgi:two-component system cell cycle response regulator DivK
MAKANILVVEDNVDNYELVRIMLEYGGYETFLAVNGRDGVNAARKQQPDLIVMDMMMPEMDGWHAAEKLKTDKSTKHIPVIALTVRTLPAERQRAMEAGVDAYLTKPINMPLFMDTIEEVLAKKKEAG